MIKKSLLILFTLYSLPLYSAQKQSVPTYLETDVVIYDKTTGIFKTETITNIKYNNNDMITQNLEFDTNTGDITANGDILITGQGGNLTTTNLTINTKNEKVNSGKTDIKFGENSYASAKSSEMTSKTKMILTDVEYTACKEGLSDCSNPPSWKIAANKIRHNTETGRLTYTGAKLYLFDTPIIYFPYFENYTPNIKNKTGLLMPSFGTTSNLGYVLQQPMFIKINDYNDMTLTPMFTSKKGTLFIGEYRTNQQHSSHTIEGSYKPSNKKDDDNRWYFKTKNYFEIDSVWRANIDIEKTSDDTYLRLYDFNSDPWLSSKIELEGVQNRSYFTTTIYDYQDLRALTNTYTPRVLPIINYRRISEPNTNGGYFDLNLNSAHIIRDYSNASRPDETSFRTSGILRYIQPLRLDSGHLFTLGLGTRGDIYTLDDVFNNSDPNNPTYESESQTRTDISADLIWKYPLYRQRSNRTEIIEPTIQIITSKRQDNKSFIPNMDSKYMELEVENLFSNNRFSGYDVFESGTRVNYGINFISNFHNNQTLSFFIGQNYNVDVPDNLYLTNSGLQNNSGLSDIVASMSYTPSRYLKINYKTRMNNENFKTNRNDVNLFIGPPALNLTINYVYLKNMYIEDELATTKDEINTYISSQLTNNWRIFIGNRYDLYENRDINIIGGLIYENDCFKFNINVINEFTRDRDYIGDKAVYFGFTFKTLGSYSTSFGIQNNDTKNTEGINNEI